MIRDPELKNYADVLEHAGFTIYEPKRNGDYFTYSRVVDGQECFGTVSLENFGGYSHTMPIKPSVAFGSTMLVDGVPNPVNGIGRAELTAYEARKVARPSNTGPYISGWHRNFKDPRWLEVGFTRRAPASAGQ